MSTCMVTDRSGQDCSLSRTSHSTSMGGLEVQFEAEPKSVPLDALAKHLWVRQRSLNLRVAPKAHLKIGRGAIFSTEGHIANVDLVHSLMK